jgi:hypothetical protein
MPLLWRRGLKKKDHSGLPLGRGMIALIENVPTGVCQVCGEQYLKAEIVKEMERLAHSRENPKKLIQVPLKELAVA